ncbi:MAG: SRPBCC family protein [Actinomycetota bacterium]|nr:SRPBCC family protein [Actinomycetota bacterium]
MELTNEFTVDVPIEEAWPVLTDLERIAPCMPGARLDQVDGDEYHGTVKVKVGPVTAEYRGKATFVERDDAGHRAVLRAEGREARGQGNASATITAQLEPAGTATRVSVTTDLTITGRVAQFGRGVLADVSTKLLGQFVDSLETMVLSGKSGAPAGAGTTAEAGGSEEAVAEGSAPAPGAEASVDLVRVAGPALAKRIIPVLGIAALVWIVWRLRSRR